MENRIDSKELLEALRTCMPDVYFEREGARWSLRTEAILMANLVATSGAVWVKATTALCSAIGEEVDRCVALYPLAEEGQRPFQIAYAISEKHREKVEHWREERWARWSTGRPQVYQTHLMALLDPAAPFEGVGPAAMKLEAALDEGLEFWKLAPAFAGAWAAYRNDDKAMQCAVVEASLAGAKRVVLALAKAQAYELDRAEEGRALNLGGHYTRRLVEGTDFRAAMRTMRAVVDGTWTTKTADEKTIYVAGSSRDRHYVRTLVDGLASRGWTVTFDWTRFHGFDVAEPSAEVLDEGARLDEEGVRCARVFWYVAPECLSEGSATELGMALALGKEVVVSGPVGPHRVFPRRATRTFAKHDEALAYLCGSV